MLLELSARNLALSKALTLEFSEGLTCLTGETGAGKSLCVDALNLALGGRADPALISDWAERLEVSAVFAVPQPLLQRLQELSLEGDDDALMQVRRVISRDGRNKTYINGRPATLTLLRELCADLVSIHGQHASHRLLEEQHQLNVLDAYAGLFQDAAQVAALCRHYQQLRSELNHLSEAQKLGALRYKSLRYEKQLLGKLNLTAGSYENMVRSFDEQMRQQQLLSQLSMTASLLDDEGEHNVLPRLHERVSALQETVTQFPRLQPALNLLAEAVERLELSRSELYELESSVSLPAEEHLNERLSLCHDLSRRFGIEPQLLYQKQAEVETQLHDFLSLREKIEQATEAVKAARSEYEKAAAVLSQKRQAAAAGLSAEVTSLIHTLAMPDGQFSVRVSVPEGMKPRPCGNDSIEFLFTANKGESLKELSSAASGGELSRLALALEAVSASVRSTPTLVFDEVDTGISGRTASAVGSLLHSLGRRVQVITVTHLPQVAAMADTQFLVLKKEEQGRVHSAVTRLDTAGRIEELARMMGGTVVQESTRESARALLEHRLDGADSEVRTGTEPQTQTQQIPSPDSAASARAAGKD